MKKIKKMNKMKYLVNMLIAYILYPFKKNSFKKKKIWIVGGNAGELYVDNGRAMYEYLRAKEGIEEYWVINKNSKSVQLTIYSAVYDDETQAICKKFQEKN